MIPCTQLTLSNMIDNVFFLASLNNFRYISGGTSFDTEDLFSIPLKTLDAIAVSLHEELNKSSISFIKDLTPENELLAKKLEVVKQVIEYRLQLKEELQTAKVNASKRQEILEALHDMQKSKLQTKTEEELLQMLETLS